MAPDNKKRKERYIYYSGGTDPEHQYGTAILVLDRIAQSVMEFVPLNDRIVPLKLRATHRDLNVVEIYAPTSDKSDQEIEEFYNKIDEIMLLTKKGEMKMII